MRPKSKAAGRQGNNYIVVVFDSCRYDSLVAARPKTIARLGEIEDSREESHRIVRLGAASLKELGVALGDHLSGDLREG